MLEAFVITNGRSTFPYVVKALKSQNMKMKISILSGMSWVDAVNEALSRATHDFYLRVDDDMILHPEAVSFMWNTLVRKGMNSCMHSAKLWEDYTGRVAGTVKIYGTDAVRRLGGFRPNRLGKVDRTFEADAAAAGEKITCACKKSPVGLHACGTWREQREYERLWGFKKSTREFMESYSLKMPPARQAEKAVALIERKNRQGDTRFWRYLNG